MPKTNMRPIQTGDEHLANTTTADLIAGTTPGGPFYCTRTDDDVRAGHLQHHRPIYARPSGEAFVGDWPYGWRPPTATEITRSVAHEPCRRPPPR